MTYDKKIYAPTSQHRMTYDEAKMYCLFLEIDGQKGWMLADRRIDSKHTILLDSASSVNYPYWEQSDEDEYGFAGSGQTFYARPMRLVK
jgi:hypothetical protein